MEKQALNSSVVELLIGNVKVLLRVIIITPFHV